MNNLPRDINSLYDTNASKTTFNHLPEELKAKILTDPDANVYEPTLGRVDLTTYRDILNEPLSKDDNIYVAIKKIRQDPDAAYEQIERDVGKRWDELNSEDPFEDAVLKTIADEYGVLVEALFHVFDESGKYPVNPVFLGVLLHNKNYDLAERYIKSLDEHDIFAYTITDYLEKFLLSVPYDFLARFQDQPLDKQLMIMHLLATVLDHPMYDILTNNEFEIFRNSFDRRYNPVSWFYKSNVSVGRDFIDKIKAVKNIIATKDMNQIYQLANSFTMDDVINYPKSHMDLMEAISDNKDLVFYHLNAFLNYFGPLGYLSLRPRFVNKVLGYGVDKYTPRSIVLLNAIEEKDTNGMYPEFDNIRDYANKTKWYHKKEPLPTYRRY